MLSKTVTGFIVPIDELPIPPDYFNKLSDPMKTAFTAALGAVVANYVEYRRQSVNMAEVPEEDGMVGMQALLRNLLQRQDLTVLNPLMILPSLIFKSLDEYLDRKALEFQPGEIQRLMGAGVPTIRYEPDRWIEVVWHCN